MASDRARLNVDNGTLAILGFFAVVIAGQSPVLLAVLGGFVFVGWLLVQLEVFDDESEATDGSQRDRDPLEVLQTRYANGEIDETGFERRLDRIMESTEAVRGNGGPHRDSREGFDSPTPTRSDRIEDRAFDLEGETERMRGRETGTEREHTS